MLQGDWGSGTYGVGVGYLFAQRSLNVHLKQQVVLIYLSSGDVAVGLVSK